MFAKCFVASAALLAFSIPAQDRIQAFQGQPEARNCTRIFYYSNPDGGFRPEGQIVITHGVPKWKDEYESEEMMQQVRGQRWRFGAGAWTTLETNVALEIGGEKIGPGLYYLALEYTEDGKMYLVVLNPEPIRAKKMDAFQAQQTTGGKKIEMAWKKDAAKQIDFEIELAADSDAPEKIMLTVRWGTHELTAKGTAKIGEGS